MHRPLEECDRLAIAVGATAEAIAAVEGAATGAGGVITTLLDVPLLFVLGLTTIRKIGHCYGYPLERHKDRHFVLGVMIAAMAGSLEVRRERINRLRELEELLIEETQEDLLTEEALSFLFQLEIFAGIPGVGIISGAVLNWLFMRRVEEAARMVFQERWLRDNGKVEHIEPAAAHARHLAPGWAGALNRVAYSGCYCMGFGVALPVYAIGSLVRRRTTPSPAASATVPPRPPNGPARSRPGAEARRPRRPNAPRRGRPWYQVECPLPGSRRHPRLPRKTLDLFMVVPPLLHNRSRIRMPACGESVAFRRFDCTGVDKRPIPRLNPRTWQDTCSCGQGRPGSLSNGRTTMAHPIPDGHHTITPHLVIKGASEAIEFYKRAFGAEEICRMPFPGPDGQDEARARRAADRRLAAVPGGRVPRARRRRGRTAIRR